MKLSEFWAAMDHEFGPVYARHLARDLVPGDFGDLTAQQALDAGANVREVWLAICRVQDVPVERQLGPDIEPRP
ncbi:MULTISPECIES: DUF3046 domain-containing protein [Rothia]|uniref:DUF3046 domain-containing protein n=3 Tax=Rothia TaxID=32207 RepID=A0A9D1ZPP8_9MICC|nr:DUF3046 domain-containing protein [Rothia nasimurium]HIY94162.1 DUF3046 domain-containing protein [Candidatus Rothia avicola]HJD50315.1 DUF3046 domain-containing protein [Candidatus Rothia avistercoris]